MGNYYVPSVYLFKKIGNCNVLKPPLITKNTISLGSKYSPDFVCTPFKYTLGTFIECLEMGADTLIQLGGGCRYGYYSELQEKILSDLGYNFKYYNLITKGHTDVKRIFKILKSINPKLKVSSLYYIFITIKMVKYMDYIENYIRENCAYEVNKGEFKKEFNNMLTDFSNVKSFFDLRKKYKRYKKKIWNIKINKPKNNIKIGVIGELYTLMEPFANNNLEDMLYSRGIEVKRFTTASYLLLG